MKQTKTKQEKIVEADIRCRHWLIEDTEAKERGDLEYAQVCQRKAQFWLDRWNKLKGDA